MKILKDWIVGLCIGSGIILVLLGLQAVTRGNQWWLAYLIGGIIIAAVFLKVAINDYQKGRVGV
jgi:uncharacterized membrane protein SirB2